MGKSTTLKKRKQSKQANKTKKRDKKGGDSFKPRCSPAKPEKEEEFTCYSDEGLGKMKDLWNIRHPNDRITTSDSQQIWRFFKDKFASTCENEKCWMRQQFAKNKLSKEMTLYIAPEAPKSWSDNPNEWLTSTDLINVMAHFEKNIKSLCL